MAQRSENLDFKLWEQDRRIPIKIDHLVITVICVKSRILITLRDKETLKCIGTIYNLRH